MRHCRKDVDERPNQVLSRHNPALQEDESRHCLDRAHQVYRILPLYSRLRVVRSSQAARVESDETASFFFCAEYPSVCNTRGQEAAPMTSLRSLEFLEQRRI